MPIDSGYMAVVAVALLRSDRHVFLQQRLAHKHHGGLWEFPGGKVEQGETPRQALIREIEEELALTLDKGSLEAGVFAEESPADISPQVPSEDHLVDNRGAASNKRPIMLLVYKCREWTGNPVPQEGQEAGWFTQKEAFSLPLAPMDKNLLERLEL